MTFDPYRTSDPHRNEPPRDLDESSPGTILLGALLLAAIAIGGFVYLYAGPSDQTSRKYDQYVRAPITQPSNMPPAPRPRPVE